LLLIIITAVSLIITTANLSQPDPAGPEIQHLSSQMTTSYMSFFTYCVRSLIWKYHRDEDVVSDDIGRVTEVASGLFSIFSESLLLAAGLTLRNIREVDDLNKSQK